MTSWECWGGDWAGSKQRWEKGCMYAVERRKNIPEQENWCVMEAVLL